MIAILDYGLGNVRAFANIYKKLDVPFTIAKCESDLQQADKLILPGVGAFDQAIRLFTASGMRARVEDMVMVEQRPLIGICVGMQMLAGGSDEGTEPGLNWIPGRVRQLDASLFEYRTRLPHMGWNDIHQTQPSPLLKGFEDRAMFYFLHSYYFDCDDSQNVLATANYGMEFAAIINHKNIYGIQCHPEKSHDFGIAVLRNFAEL